MTALALHPVATPHRVRRVRRPGVRRESRTERVRILEYCRFPRRATGDHTHLGFTRDESSLGRCVGVDRAETVGTLLRVSERALDGGLGPARIERVVWCQPGFGGRFWIGLERMAEADDG